MAVRGSPASLVPCLRVRRCGGGGPHLKNFQTGTRLAGQRPTNKSPNCREKQRQDDVGAEQVRSRAQLPYPRDVGDARPPLIGARARGALPRVPRDGTHPLGIAPRDDHRADRSRAPTVRGERRIHASRLRARRLAPALARRRRRGGRRGVRGDHRGGLVETRGVVGGRETRAARAGRPRDPRRRRHRYPNPDRCRLQRPGRCSG
mmetsp:Transcript_3875/g.17845  ORF Transcript_3875/g.17845 Transcript_3875/m.17845 type:complete len:205 (+) Transcript_3875:4095-4709(+)